MRQKRTKISMLKSYIARTNEGQERLNQNYETLEQELKRVRLNNLKNNE